MPLAAVTRSGTTPSWSHANQSPVRQKPVWISSATNTTPLLAAPVGERAAGSPSAGTTKPPSPSIGSITTQATLSAPTCLSITSIARAAACAPRDRGRLAERVGHRRPVDLAGERTEAVLVGHVLRGHRHRQVGAPVVGVVEDDHRVAAGVRAGDLDRVLDRLGAGVEQGGLLRVVAGRQLGERLAHLDVPLVRRDHEAGVGECRHLVGDPARRPRARLLPTLVTAIPLARSISELPSTSTITPPPAAST